MSRPLVQADIFRSAPGVTPLVRRLEEYSDLSPMARAALEEVATSRPVIVEARRDLIRQGDRPTSVYVIRTGWACRYKVLEDGRRQIVDFPIPGDLCDLNIYVLSRMDHSIGALTRLEVVPIDRERLERLVRDHADVATVLWWQELASRSCDREWIVNVGLRSARERISHLFCEMFLRLESVGLTRGYSCEFPPTQQDIAEATGLTAVHVNRTIGSLRNDGLIKFEKRILTIPDMAALKRVSMFNPDYLHLERLRRHPNLKGPMTAGTR